MFKGQGRCEQPSPNTRIASLAVRCVEGTRRTPIDGKKMARAPTACADGGLPLLRSARREGFANRQSRPSMAGGFVISLGLVYSFALVQHRSFMQSVCPHPILRWLHMAASAVQHNISAFLNSPPLLNPMPEGAPAKPKPEIVTVHQLSDLRNDLMMLSSPMRVRSLTDKEVLDEWSLRCRGAVFARNKRGVVLYSVAGGHEIKEDQR